MSQISSLNVKLFSKQKECNVNEVSNSEWMQKQSLDTWIVQQNSTHYKFNIKFKSDFKWIKWTAVILLK